MSKRNSRYNIFKHIRMMLKAAPVRHELELRAMMAARVEADESTGEIFGRDGKSPRQVLAETGNIASETSLKTALKAMRDAKLFKAHRIYTYGDRAGADRLVLDWDAWDEHYEKLVLNAVNGCSPLNGLQPEEGEGVEARSTGSKGGSLTGSKGVRLTGSNSNKDTATSNGDSNGDSAEGDLHLPPTSDSPPPEDPAGSSPSVITQGGAELHMPTLTPGCELNGSVPWVARGSQPGQVPASYRQAVYYDRPRARLALVDDARGKALYQALREDYSIDVIKRGMVAATVKAPEVLSRNRGNGALNGGLDALVRTYCGYEANRGQAVPGVRGTGQFKPYKGGAFVP